MDEIQKTIQGVRAAYRERIYNSFLNAQEVDSDDKLNKSKESNEFVEENIFEKYRREKSDNVEKSNIIDSLDYDSIDDVVDTINNNFNKGLIDELTAEKAVEQLDSIFEKAGMHKYIRREGSPGNYKYYYTEEEYRQAKGNKEGENENKPITFETSHGDALTINGNKITVKNKFGDTYEGTIEPSGKISTKSRLGLQYLVRAHNEYKDSKNNKR